MNGTKLLRVGFGLALLAFGPVSSRMACGQILANDTLIIGNVIGSAGTQVAVPVYIKNTVPYQGWQIPIKIGSGAAPLNLDSMSLAGSCMMTVPYEWWFIAPFKNNNQWGNVRACGVAAIIDMYTQDTLWPGNWLVMKIYVTINPGTASQTFVIDTASCSWSNGGPLNSLAITYRSSSYRCRVRPGSIFVPPIGVGESASRNVPDGFEIFPTVVKPGVPVNLRFAGRLTGAGEISVIDRSGRVVGRQPIRDATGNTGIEAIATDGWARGVYFVTANGPAHYRLGKFIVE